MSRIFEAKYPGRCGQCDERIDEGDPVRFDDDELVHDKCKELHTPDPCSKCWTIHAGECL